jgi:DNA-binding FrmR family transcriptional regulator
MQDERKVEVLRRLKSVAGHLKGVEKMIEDDAYCLDLINQIQAIQSALNKINLHILDDHLHGCLATAVRGEDAGERERMLGEIATLFERSAKI